MLPASRRAGGLLRTHTRPSSEHGLPGGRKLIQTLAEEEVEEEEKEEEEEEEEEGERRRMF